MKLFVDGRSRFLSGTALALAGLCGLMFALALSDLLLLLRVSSTSAFYLFLARATVPDRMPALAAFAAGHPVALCVMGVALWLSGCVLALGVWRRAEWARRGAVAMLYLLASAALLALLFPGLIVPAQLIYDGADIAPEFNTAVRTAAVYLRIVCVGGGGLCLWWALALDRGALRAEFAREPGKS
ncbi:MAG TPA: hypothetical protein PKI19_06735 [Elusimicrobiales bacterium]|nr:hypothetical protein [Elusimicrobiales bacterium]